MDIPTREPDCIVRGDTAKWIVDPGSDYPPGTWSLQFAFVTASTRVLKSGADNGDGRFLMHLTPADSLLLATPGLWFYQAKVTDGTDEYTIRKGRLEVIQEFESQASGFDARSHWKKVLDALESVLQGKASKDVLSYSIATRSLAKASWDELRSAYEWYAAKYQAELEKERIAQGRGGRRGRVLVRF